jgi:hypothetical protein
MATIRKVAIEVRDDWSVLQRRCILSNVVKPEPFLPTEALRCYKALDEGGDCRKSWENCH